MHPSCHDDLLFPFLGPLTFYEVSRRSVRRPSQTTLLVNEGSFQKPLRATEPFELRHPKIQKRVSGWRGGAKSKVRPTGAKNAKNQSKKVSLTHFWLLLALSRTSGQRPRETLAWFRDGPHQTSIIEGVGGLNRDICMGAFWWNSLCLCLWRMVLTSCVWELSGPLRLRVQSRGLNRVFV